MFKSILSGIALTLIAISPSFADSIILKSAATGKYVGEASNGLLVANNTASSAIKLEVITLESTLVAFRAENGQYLRAGVGSGTHLQVASPHIRSWETFQRIPTNGGKVAFMSSQNGNYVTVGADGRLSATATRITEREMFSLANPAIGFINPAVGQLLANATQQRPPVEAAAPADPPAASGVPENDAHLYEGFWKIAMVSNQQGILYSPRSEHYRRARVQITSAGNLVIDTGCNTISGNIKINDHQVTVGNLYGTTAQCDEALSKLEDDIIFALKVAQNFAGSTNGGDIYFFNNRQQEVLVLRPAR